MLQVLRAYPRALRALHHAKRHGIPGLNFAYYGQSLARRLLWKGSLAGLRYLTNPVSITRYFEFSFALDYLPENASSCLDVGSPRLFSYYVVDTGAAKQVKIINPDPRDAQVTERIRKLLDFAGITVSCTDVRSELLTGKKYNCIWSISVIEHISGNYEDTDAVKWMYGALNEGGRLILTFPVDRQYWKEYRSGEDPYGTQERADSQQYFFQRFYDLDSIRQRLLEPVGVSPVTMRWFGEKQSGHFHDYIRRWLEEGWQCTVEDPREIADHYQEYESWEEMPGVGVCGIVIEKQA